MLLTQDDDVPALTAGCSVLHEALHRTRDERGMRGLTGQARILLCQADCCERGVDTCIYIWQTGSAEQQPQYNLRTQMPPCSCLHQRHSMIALAQELQYPGYHNQGEHLAALGCFHGHGLLERTYQ